MWVFPFLEGLVKNLLKKLLLTLCLLFLCSSSLAQDKVVNPIFMDMKNIFVIEDPSVMLGVGNEDYIRARSSFHEGLKEYEDVPKKTAAFNEAIKAINLATNKEPDNPLYWLLESQIYRSRGGLGYAKNYFAKACGLYEERLKKYPESISFNLQYAVTCYAGDAQFYADYSNYKLRAAKYAKKSLQLINEVEMKPEFARLLGLVKDDFVEQKFLAYIILQDDKKIAKLIRDIKNQYDQNDLRYRMAIDYENLVVDGVWHWKTNSRDGAEKSFLMYYLRDLID